MLIATRASTPLPATGRWELRQRLASHVIDESLDRARPHLQAWAVYSLSDPRHLRAYRYVGQTRAPVRRLLQHVAAARVAARAASTDDTEARWWIAPGECAPLQAWIQALYAEGRRLPCLVIHRWEASARDALDAERLLIDACLAQGPDLCNVEARRGAHRHCLTGRD